MNKLFIQRKQSRKLMGESGQVAIVTVTMFMVLFAILIVSFTRVMATASHETVSDELKAKARAAAESGIEDAKRILSYCYGENDKFRNNPNYQSQYLDLCRNQILKGKTQQNCDTILGSGLTRVIGIETDGDKRAKVDTLTEHERYLCLIIDPLTENIEGMLGGGKGDSKVIPLELRNINGELRFPTDLTLKWHLLKAANEGGDGVIGISDIKGGSDWPQVSEWGKAPAALRIELVNFDEGSGFTIDQLSQNARAVTLRPSRDQGSGIIAIKNFVAKDAINTQTVPLSSIKCNLQDGYACSTKLDIQSLSEAQRLQRVSPNTKYYLRIQTIYDASTHFDLRANQGSEKLYFLGVQPEVDVTGQSSDAFQRIRARIEAEPKNGDLDIFANWWPEYAIDTDGKVCKKMKVSADNGTDECL